MRTMIDYRNEIGPAAWLLVLYWQHSTPANDPDWCPVANGERILDSNAAITLKVSLRTAIRWRHRLCDAGLIITDACPVAFGSSCSASIGLTCRSGRRRCGQTCQRR